MLCSYHVNWYDGAVLLIPLTLAFACRPALPKLVAAPLLFAFPVWAFSNVIAGLMLLLLIAFVLPAVTRLGGVTPESATEPEAQTQ